MISLVGVAYSAGEAGAVGAVGAGRPPVPLDLFFLIFIVIMFYFVLWRPQSKKAKAHRELVGSLEAGDEVMTTGGILGRITRLTDDYMAVEVADNVEICLQRGSVVATLPKGTIGAI